jgi:N-ethylmaleimide reductase
MSLLFSRTVIRSLALQNRLVMAPLTRSRAIGNIPNALMAEYYGARAASVGLVIAEGTSPSPNGLGYARIPGIFSTEQVEGWKRVTTAVHAQGAKMFLQLMHCGRIAHPLNLPPGGRVLAPSAISAAGEIWTDAQQLQPEPAPEAMSEKDIQQTIAEFAQGARNAIAAGFDGIELHGANGYLLEQFIRPTSNTRVDRYGGSIGNRARFVLEVVDATIQAIGNDRVGIRISPFGIFNNMPLYPEVEADYTYLARELNARGLMYIHLAGAPQVPESVRTMLRSMSNCALILSGGYDFEHAESDLAAGKCALIAVGKPILANPDLRKRWETGLAVNAPDMSTFYTPGPKGYTDYPTLA